MYWHSGSVACTACTAASQQEGHGIDSRIGRCWSSPDLQFSGWLPPWPFCVEFACSPRVHKGFLHTEPQHKNMQKNRKDRSLSVPDQDWTEHLAWSPGAKKKGCPLLLAALRKDKDSRM